MIKIALVGRPNVGKSTLFNRLVGSRKAIVNDQPGVTRDRKYSKARLVDLEFILIDTAGIDNSLIGNIYNEIKLQTDLAIADADLVIFVIDGRAGVLPVEKEFSKKLKIINKSVILLINKCEGSGGGLGISESSTLGFGTSIPFSAEHGEGLSDLYDELNRFFIKYNHTNISGGIINETKTNLFPPIRLGIIGRPNTGKSTLLNNIIDEKRVVTGPKAGTTRDAIEVSWFFDKQPFCIVDTAGLRRKSKISDVLEKSMISDTLKTIKYSNICILMIDASIGIEKQDLAIARMIVNEGRGLIIGANMWDKVINKDETKNNIFYQLKNSLSQSRDVPVAFISGLHGNGMKTLMSTALDIRSRLDIRISTGKLNRWLMPIIENNPAPLYKGKVNRIRYITQVNVRPPTFALFMSSPENLPESYSRFLKGVIMDDFNLAGLPIRLMLRKGNNPYVEN